MAMTIRRRKDTDTPRVFMHKVADVRGGVSVASSDLAVDWLPEGAVLSAPENGICHVIKTAVLAAASAAADTTIKLAKGHTFGVGDVLMASEGAAAVTISKIDTSSKAYDVATVSAALGALKAGDVVMEAAAEGKAGALKRVPFALNGTGKPVVKGDNIDTDAWLIGVTHGLALPDAIAKHLPGIINY